MTQNTLRESQSLAIIPARGGSKGLPRKNVRQLGSQPLIAHTIQAALQSRINRAIVSTDDEEIAEIARSYGAEVPFIRPPEYSGDAATSLSVLLHAVRFMEQELNYQPSEVMFLQPTSPFRTADHIDGALANYFKSGTTSLISVTDVQEFHPYFMFKLKDEHKLETLFELKARPLRRQELPTYYRINGAIYISNRSYYEGIEDNAAIFDWNSVSAYVMDAPSSIDINDYIDFQHAELLLKKKMETEA